MANINVGLQTSNDPNYTGAVKEASRFDYNNSSKYNTLFSDLADNIKNGVEGAKNVVNSMIKEDVRYGYDKIIGAQGVDVAADNPLTPAQLDKGGNPSVMTSNGSTAAEGPSMGGSTSGSPMDANRPPQAQQDSFKNRIQSLQAAYSQGRIGDTYYTTQLEAMNRAIRAKYPGFRDEVDAMVQTITGINPANSLRKAVLNDLSTAQSEADKAQNKIQDFAKSNLEYLSPQTIQKVAQGKATMGDLMLEVQPQKIEENRISLAKSRLALKKDQNAATSEDASQTATQVINSIDSKLMNSTSVNGVSINGWLDKIREEIKDGKSLTPDRENQIKAEFLQMKQNYENGLNNMWNSSLAPGNKNTLASTLNDPGRQKAINDNAMKKFDLIEQAITNKDYGLLNQTSNAIKSMTDNTARTILEKYPTIGVTSAIAKMPGMANILQNLMTSQPGMYSDLQNQVSSAIRVHNLTGGVYQPEGQTSASDDLKTYASVPGNKTPEGMNRYLRERAIELSNPQLPLDMRANAARKMFSADNNQFILKWGTSGSKVQMFNTLTSPEITKSMEEIGKLNPDVWQNYSKWSMNTFANGFKTVFNDVNNVNNRELIDVKWDPASKQFAVFPSEKGIEDSKKYSVGLGGFIIRQIEQRNNLNVSNAVGQVNSMIKNIEPILKANGFDPAKEIPNLTRNIQIQDKKNSTFWGKLVSGSSTDDAGLASFGGSSLNFTEPSSRGQYATDKVMESEKVNHGADLKNLNAGAQKMLDGLIGEGVVDKIEVKSGFRDPERNARAGGAKYSKHLDGSAVDLDISGYSDEQKAAVLDAAIKHGAKGIGVYPSGNSLHIDTRETPTTWGFSPFGKYKGVDISEQPKWAQEPLKKLFNK